ncbi:hypothetical protein GGF44_005465, partial [Coemansia sp. RSA 1694]
MAEAEGSGSSKFPPPPEKLPQNARRLGALQQQQQQQQQQSHQRPLSLSPALPLTIGNAGSASRSVYSHRSQQRDSSSLRARATEILSDPMGDRYSSPSLSSSSPLKHHGLLMERAAVARRVKRHLVTRPISASPPAAPQLVPASSNVVGPVPPRLSHSLDELAGLAALFPADAAAAAAALDESG